MLNDKFWGFDDDYAQIYRENLCMGLDLFNIWSYGFEILMWNRFFFKVGGFIPYKLG